MKKKYTSLPESEQNQLDYFFAGTDERQRLFAGTMYVQEAAWIIKDALEKVWALVQQSDEAFLSYYHEVQPENQNETFLGRVCQKVQELHPLFRVRGALIPDQIPAWALGEVSVLRFARKSADPLLSTRIVREEAEALAQEKEYTFKKTRNGALAPAQFVDDLLERLTQKGEVTNRPAVYRALKESGFRAPNAWFSHKMKPASRTRGLAANAKRKSTRADRMDSDVNE